MKSLIAALIFTFALTVSASTMTNLQSPYKKTTTVTKVEDKTSKTVKKSRTTKKCDGKCCCSKDGKMDKDCKMNKDDKSSKDCKTNQKVDPKK